jgi:hypothetical protein
MNRLCVLTAGAVGLLLNCLITQSSADAAMILGLRYSDLSTSKNVAVGEVLLVDLVIEESGVDTFLFDEGLGDAGGRIIRTGTASVSSATVGGGTVTANPGFNTSVVSPAFTEVGEVGSVLASTLLGPGVGVGTSLVQIAQFQFTVAGTVGQSATLTASLDNLNANFSFDTGTDLDALITSFGSVDFTITSAAVPEPASMLLGGLTVLLAGGAAWRRRRMLVDSSATTVS